MAVLQLESSIGGREAAIRAQMRQRGDETLVDIQGRELVQLLEQVRALRHDLRQQGQRVNRALSHAGTKLRPAEEQGSGFLGCARVGDIAAVGRETLTPERLSGCCDDGDKTAPNFYLVAQNDMSFEHDEDTIRCSAALIYLKAGGPCRFCAVQRYRCNFFGGETRASRSSLCGSRQRSSIRVSSIRLHRNVRARIERARIRRISAFL